MIRGTFVVGVTRTEGLAVRAIDTDSSDAGKKLVVVVSEPFRRREKAVGGVVQRRKGGGPFTLAVDGV